MARATAARGAGRAVDARAGARRGTRATRVARATRANRATTTTSSATATSDAAVDALEALREVKIARAVDGVEVDAVGDVIAREGRVAALFLTQFGDFDSWELAQRLVDDLDAMKRAGVRVVAIGIGSADAAREFSKRTRFPLENLYADEGGKCHEALGFAPGLGRAGGDLSLIHI